MHQAMKKIKDFDLIYEKQITLLKKHPKCYAARFVEQYCYLYDSRKIGTPCNPLDILKLYFLQIERKEIKSLSMWYGKSFQNKVYYFLSYFEKGELYIEICIGGMYIKTFLTSWIASLNLKIKQKIPVELIY